jgi:hypothetical protein
MFFINIMLLADDFAKPIQKDLFDIKDSWGSLGVSYKTDETNKYSFSDKENNSFSVIATYGRYFGNSVFGVGFEVAGWSDLGMDIAMSPRVHHQIVPNLSPIWQDMSYGEISQLYVTYHNNNLASQIGRIALSRKISPWLFSDRSVSVLDFAYDGVLVEYVQNNNQYFVGWIVNLVNLNNEVHLGDKGLGVWFISTHLHPTKKSKLNNAFYIFPKSEYNLKPNVYGQKETMWSWWFDILYRFHGFADAMQFVYCDGELNEHATIAFANQIRLYRKKYSLKATFAYISDGKYSLKSAGFKYGSSAFWGQSLNGEFGADRLDYKQYIYRLEARYKIVNDILYAGVAYDDFDGFKPWHIDDAFVFQLGYILNIKHVKYQLEYRYKHQTYIKKEEFTKKHLHLDIIYKF